jgi:hypothetical protein
MKSTPAASAADPAPVSSSSSSSSSCNNISSSVAQVFTFVFVCVEHLPASRQQQVMDRDEVKQCQLLNMHMSSAAVTTALSAVLL